MINQKQIEKAVGKIICGRDQGSAFLITPNIVLTARHNIADYSQNIKINIEFPNVGNTGEVREAIPVNIDLSEKLNLDVVILRLNNTVDIDCFELENSQIPFNSEWNSFGYYHQDTSSTIIGKDIRGIVTRIIDQSLFNWDTQLTSTDNKDIDLSGLSGAPLIIDYVVRGLIVVQGGSTIGAISINKMRKILDHNDIAYSNRTNETDVPDSIKKNIENSLPNFEMFDIIENKIEENGSRYLFLKGTHGSGKTTLISSFSPLNKDIIICGRYIINIPNDKYQITYRCNETVFAKWIENSISRIITNTPSDASEVDYTKHIELINNYFIELGEYLLKKKQKGVFFIDGIDELCKFGNVNKFFSLLPPSLPENISIVLASNSVEMYPDFLSNLRNKDNIIDIKQLEQYDCEMFLNNKLKKYNLQHSQIIQISKMTEGNPLYLNYIADYFDNNLKDNNFNEILNSFPKYSGDISKYYESIWTSIFKESDKVWILSTIARLREGLERKEFINTLPDKYKQTFTTYFPQIKHLLIDPDLMVISHSSLSYFIEEKTQDINDEVHKNISNFCNTNLKNIYSIRNYLYHLSNSSDDLKVKAIHLCNQEWIDGCALEFVEPDIILNDVKIILELAIENKVLSEIIRLLLLLQRLKFRYNNMFAENASDIAKALIEMGQATKALDYIIRESALIVSNDDSLYFLNRFYEIGKMNEANKLYNVIRERVIFINEKINEKGGYPAWLFEFELMSNTIYQNEKTNHSKEILKNNFLMLFENFRRSVEAENKLGNYLVGKSQAYQLWNSNKYVRIKEFFKIEPKEPKDITVLLSYVIVSYKIISKEYKSLKNIKTLSLVIEDLEYLLTKYGTNNIELTIDALIEYSCNHELVDIQIKQLKQNNYDIKIRMDNGVDIDWNNIEKALSVFKNIGYSNENELKIPEIDNENWEDWLKSIIRTLGLISGQSFKIKAMKKDKENQIAKLKELLAEIQKIELKNRFKWDCSYNIPESLLPFIYGEYTYTIIAFCPELIPYLIKEIKNNSTYQMGLYTEGYREILFIVCDYILLDPEHSIKIYDLLLILEKHIEDCVLNRLERTRDFMKLIELYGRIGSKEMAVAVYKKMLDTSMGLSWYKEDQLALMNTCINNLNFKTNVDIGEYLGKVADILDYADGEITFQRYVRAEKHNFIGALCNSGYLNKAIEYFKKESFPKAKTIVKNAESSLVDMPLIGMGYINGCKEIIEQDAILRIMQNSSITNPLIKWALTEVYILGDTRYFNEYAQIQSDILNEEAKLKSKYYNILIDRVIRQIIAEFDFDYQKKYILYIKTNLSDMIYKNIMSKLEENKFDLTTILPEVEVVPTSNVDKRYDDKVDKSDSLYLPGTFGKQEGLIQLEENLRKANKELEIKNIINAKEFLVSGFKVVQDSGWPIWNSNLSQKATEARQLLIDISGTAIEYIYSIKELILKELHESEWNIVDRIINDIGSKISNDEASGIFKIIINHLETMLILPKNSEENNLIFKEIKNVYNVNYELTKLLIWFMQYPDFLVKEKTIEIYSWLCKTDPEFFIPHLIEECGIEEVNSKEIAAGILHGLTIDDNDIVWKILKYNQAYKDKLIETQNFMVRCSFLEIIELVKGKEPEKIDFKKGLLKKLEDNYEKEHNYKDNFTNPEWFDRALLEIIEFINEDWLDDNFKFELSKKIEDVCKPCSIEEMLKVDDYITRSYSLSKGLYSIFDKYIHASLNNILNEHITDLNYKEISEVIRIYNPSFPKNHLSLEINKIVDIIRNVFDNFTCPSNFMEFNNRIIIHYQVQIENKVKDKFDSYKIKAIIIEEKQLSSLINSYTPIIIDSEINFVEGGIFSPVQLHYQFKRNMNCTDKDIQTQNWRYGRNTGYFRFGMPIQEGSLSTIDQAILNKLEKPYKIVWLIEDQVNRIRVIYDYEKNKIIKQ